MFVHMAAMPLDRPIGDGEVAVEQPVNVFGIQAVAELGKSGEIGEQHAHLAPLPGDFRRHRSGSGRRLIRTRQRRCGAQQPFAMAQRQA